MFHAKDGWYFGRTNDGSVHIVALGDVEVVLDTNTWCSAVASVSARGDAPETFQEAQNLHSKGK